MPGVTQCLGDAMGFHFWTSSQSFLWTLRRFPSTGGWRGLQRQVLGPGVGVRPTRRLFMGHLIEG